MVEVRIEGMSCEHCVRHASEALSALEGVSAVSVSLEEGTAELETSAEVSDERIRAALDEEGYAATAIVRS